MKYTVFYLERAVGETDLENLDQGMNVRWGTFIPTTGYVNIRPQVIREDDTIIQHFKILDERGNKVTGWITIRDYSDSNEQGECEIEVLPILSDRLLSNKLRRKRKKE